MANKEIVPYGFDPSKKPDALAMTVVSPKVTPICSSQSYFTQAIRRSILVPPPPRPLLEDKPRQQEPCLDLQKLIKVMKEINLLPLKGHEVLTGMKTNKFGDVTCEKTSRSPLVPPLMEFTQCWIRSRLFHQRGRRGRHHHHLS